MNFLTSGGTLLIQLFLTGRVITAMGLIFSLSLVPGLDSTFLAMNGDLLTNLDLRELVRFAEFMIPRFVKEGKSTLTVAVGCTGGRHRSVAVAEALRARLRKTGGGIKIYHRDLYK